MPTTDPFWAALGPLPPPVGQPGFSLPETGPLRPFVVTAPADLPALRPYGIEVVPEGEWGRSSQPLATIWLDPGTCCRQLRVVLRPSASEARLVLAGRHGASGSIYLMGRRCTILDAGNAVKNSSVFLSLWSDDSLFFWGRNATANGLVSELMNDGRRLLFGEDCMLATEVMIRPSDMHPVFSLNDLTIMNQSRSGQVVVHPHVWLGQRCMVLKDVEIGAGSIISACSVVTKPVPPYSLVAGVPARIIRSGVSWTRQQTPSEQHLVQTRDQVMSYPGGPDSF